MEEVGERRKIYMMDFDIGRKKKAREGALLGPLTTRVLGEIETYGNSP